jgi:ATP-dependent DNA helicase RecQ
LPEPERARVLNAFERLGRERLAPVHETLSGAVPYEELHLLRLYLLLTLKQYD